jgi:hypothetical protein
MTGFPARSANARYQEANLRSLSGLCATSSIARAATPLRGTVFRHVDISGARPHHPIALDTRVVLEKKSDPCTTKLAGAAKYLKAERSSRRSGVEAVCLIDPVLDDVCSDGIARSVARVLLESM